VIKLAVALAVVLVTLVRTDAQRAPATTYLTNFPLAEDPISEGGRWINGHAVGVEWKDVRTTKGLAFGADASGKAKYRDPTALLAGAWGPNQAIQARVRTVNQQRGKVFEEVEIRLRSTITPHSNVGYEINFRCTHDATQYVQIVRWNGPLGNFTYIATGRGPGLRDGDIVKATVAGTVITAYINGAQVLQAADATFPSGSPGMGFYLDGLAGVNSDFGFTSFAATDGATLPSLAPPPSPLRVAPTLQR
jgi:hypothetical protein